MTWLEKPIHAKGAKEKEGVFVVGGNPCEGSELLRTKAFSAHNEHFWDRQLTTQPSQGSLCPKQLRTFSKKMPKGVYREPLDRI